jgi:hypothetical protein
MNLEIAVQILQLALSLVLGQSTGRVQSDAALAETLTRIVRIAAQAYRSHLGQPMDPSLIKSEPAI